MSSPPASRQSANLADRPNPKAGSDALQTVALAVILIVLACRPFVAEVSFRISEMSFVSDARQAYKPPAELFRIVCAAALLAACLLWASSEWTGRRRVRGWSFLLLAVLLAGWSLAGTFKAVDRRGSLDDWFEQFVLMLTAFAVMNIARSARRFMLIAVVLAGLCGAMAAKGLLQATIEHREQVALYQEDPAKMLSDAGVEPGSPQARLLERRVMDRSATGYMGLSNDFASLLLVLTGACAGLAAEKLTDARRRRRLAPPGKGEIHLPTLAAYVTAAMAAASAVALVLTNSKGGVAAGVVGGVAAGAVAWKRDFFLRHRRGSLAAAAALLLAAIVGVTALGIARGGLPGRSFQVRWEYWVGSVPIVQQAPLLGVGPGGFGEAYVKYRLPEAAESTRTAHNLIVDAVVQYGIPGGLLYLGTVIWVLVAMCRPGSRSTGVSPVAERPAPSENMCVPTTGASSSLRCAFWIILLALAVLLVRTIYSGTFDFYVFILESAMPAGIFAVMLAAAFWTGDRLGACSLDGGKARIALGAGALAFVLHNLLTHSLWSPNTATIFWIASAAAVGPIWPENDPLPNQARSRLASISPAILAGACLVGLALAVIFLLGPAAGQRTLIAEASVLNAQGQHAQAAAKLEQATQADKLDGIAPAELARLQWASATAGDMPANLAKAARSAEMALARAPNASNTRLLSDILFDQADPSGLLCAWRGRVVNADNKREQLEKALLQRPGDPMLVCQLAEVLAHQKQYTQAYRLLESLEAKAPHRWPKLQDHLGDLAWLLDQSDTAREHWKKYQELESRTDEALRRRALELAQLALSRDPMDLGLHQILAERYWQMGMCDHAMRQIDATISINDLRPADSDIRYTEHDLAELGLLREKCRQMAASAASRPEDRQQTRP